MKTDSVEVTLTSRNYGRKHSFSLVQHEGEINAVLIVDGNAVASLSVETMTKDVKDDDGDYHTKPSDNFFITFSAVEPVCKKECSATVWMASIAVDVAK